MNSENEMKSVTPSPCLALLVQTLALSAVALQELLPPPCLALLVQTSAVSRVTLDKLWIPSNQRQDVNLGLPVDASCAQQ